MTRAQTSSLALVGAMLVPRSACGGGDNTDAHDAANATVTEPTNDEVDVGDADAGAANAGIDAPEGGDVDAGAHAGDGDLPTATARYTPHGAQAEHPIGPSGTQIDELETLVADC